MGSIGAAYSSPSYLNFVNPASLSELRLATYVFGVLNNDLTISDETINQSTNSTSLSYFSIAFPLTKKNGGSLWYATYFLSWLLSSKYIE